MTLSDTASSPSQDPIASLTRTEAEARAALLRVERYDLEVDLTAMLEGTTWRSTSTVTFTCASPGATTFVDCVGEVVSATLNGAALDVSTHLGGRLPLPDLAAENVLVVDLVQHDTERGAGIQRTVDDSDGLVYVWTSFEADDARYMNHADAPNCDVSQPEATYALRDIAAGEELTCNYNHFFEDGFEFLGDR